MQKFCYEKKGAISVFLTMILLPVLLIVWVIRTFFGGGRKGW